MVVEVASSRVVVVEAGSVVVVKIQPCADERRKGARGKD